MTPVSPACSTSTADPALQTIDLAVGYRSHRVRQVVLDNLNVCAHPGELVCLLGPNGIGKSTLLRTLARMQPAMSGIIELGGCDVRRLHQVDLARRVGVVLTEQPIVGALTAVALVQLGRYPHCGWFGRLSRRDHEVVRWALDAVGARHLAARDSGKLSDGERQRIMIARALAQEPLVILLDEPTAFLDVSSRVELMGLLRRLARDQRLAVVVSTHDLELALRTADTVWLIMPDGRLHAGAPEDIVADGRVEEAFRGEAIRFRAEERTFRLLSGGRGEAVVRGRGLHAALAAAVLEREGFAVVAHRPAALTISADCAPGWHASFGDRLVQGERFAELAAFVRGLPDAVNGEITT